MAFDYKAQGKKNKRIGADTEKRTRLDLEERDWIVSKWQNNIKDDKLVPVKNMFRGPHIPMMLGSGFPDFMAYKLKDNLYEVFGVEVKTNGILSKEEKEKCVWLLENKIFSKILIARREQDGMYIEIKYKEFGSKEDWEFEDG